jgi:hypothetical protein
MKKILIIGTGPSGVSVLENIKKNKYHIDIVDGNEENIPKKKNLNQFNKSLSPKYNNQEFKITQRNFIKNYNVQGKKFFISSTLSRGGGTSFWGSGLELPDKLYFTRNKLKISDFKKFYKKTLNFFDYNRSSIYKDLTNEFNNLKSTIKGDNFFFLKKLKLAIDPKTEKNDKNNYLNHSYFNTYDKISIYKKKNIKYINCTVKKITKKKKFTVSFSNNNSTQYDIIFCCAGNLGSSIIVLNLLKIRKITLKIFHTPMFLLLFITLNPFIIIKNLMCKFKFSLPCANIIFKSNKKNFRGSIMFLHNLKLKINNFLPFNFLKFFIVGGNFFLDQTFSKTYLVKINKKYKIIFRDINFPDFIKKKIIKLFLKNFFLPVPFLNLNRFITGSDAHYTSSLYFLNKRKKIFNINNELVTKKNFFVLDGSLISPGLIYPTFFTIVNNFKVMNSIIKKNVI